MANIQEGLRNYLQAIYYLQLYYQISHDKDAHKRIITIAKEQRYIGHEKQDIDHLLSRLNTYKIWIMKVCGGLCALVLLMMLFAYIKRKPISANYFIYLFLFSIGLILPDSLALIQTTKGMVHSIYAPLMQAPAQTSNKIDEIPQGTKIKILKQGPIWHKIQYDNQQGYIKRRKINVFYNNL